MRGGNPAMLQRPGGDTVTGATVDRGTLHDGTAYRIWLRSDGRRFGFVTIGGRERRRSLNWLRKQLRVKP